MSTPITHVLLVTDASGSMYTLAGDVRGGYNAYLQDLRADTEKSYRVTSSLFSDGYELLCTASDPADVPQLDEVTYRPGGMTALFDAIGKTITDFERAVPTLNAGDKVLLVVQTDGKNNTSVEYTGPQIKSMIAEREATGAWTSMFVGAGPDTWRQGEAMGFTSTVAVAASGPATASSYSGLSTATRGYSRGSSSEQMAEQVRNAQA